MNQKIKTALAGFGLSGKYFHYPFIMDNEYFELKYIQSSRMHEIHALNGEVIVKREFKDLVETDVDLIIITSPNHLHYEFCKLALAAGKHVLIEKPFVETTAEAIELKELAQSKNVSLTVFHNRRYDGDFLTIKDLIDADKLGEIKTFETHFDRFRPEVDQSKWREGEGFNGGVFYDLGPHIIDQVLDLFGKPFEIDAHFKKMREGSIADDYFQVIFTYPNMIATMSVSCFNKLNPIKFLVNGTKGSYLCDGLDIQEMQLKQDVPVESDIFGKNLLQKSILDTTEFSGHYPMNKGSYKSFYNSLAFHILKDSVAPVDIDSAILTVEVMESIQKHAKRN